VHPVNYRRLVAGVYMLHVPVLELDPGRVPWHEDGAARGLAPRGHEAAPAVGVGNEVVRGGADDEGAAREPGDLDQHQLLGAVAVGV
jgi:hypothetical protein